MNSMTFICPLNKFTLVFVILACLSTIVTCRVTTADDAKYLQLTREEKIALDKLKLQVLDLLPEDFMKTDFYLIRWIRTANLDVGKAQNLLLKMVKWRADNNISKIRFEDFSDMDDFRMNAMGGRDREGHPFGTIDLGEWDLRGAVIQGRRPRLQRYLTYAIEVGMHELFRAQKESSKPITKGLVLVDGMGGNARQHLCPQCIAILFTWIQTMENYYPSFFWEIIMINAPPITAIGLQAVRPAMSEETQRILKIMDTNKSVWMKYLDERIDRRERTPKYGGTKKVEASLTNIKPIPI